jgi:hypothetical protein
LVKGTFHLGLGDAYDNEEQHGITNSGEKYQTHIEK